MTPWYDDPLVTLYLGDCIEVMRELPDASVDAVVTDPPYGLEFMGKEWDRLVSTQGGNDAFRARAPKPTKSTFKDGVGFNIGTPKKNPRCRGCGKLKFDHEPRKCRCQTPQWDTRTAEYARTMGDWHYRWASEAWRVLKPGGYMLAFGGTRTYHRLAAAIEDAGFEIRDCLMHIYASGFPKSLNVSKDERFCHCGREAVSQHDMSGVRDADLPEAVPASGGEAVLLPSLSEQRPRVRRRNRPDATEAEASLWPAEPSVEGRGDVLQDTRQLHRSPVRPGAGVGEADGPQGRVHHGAPAGDGRVDRPAAGPDGGGQPQGSRPVEQRPGEPGVVAVQRDAQGGGIWPVCSGCGKPQIPNGLGTALKPAFEPIVMARKPLIGSVAANVLAHGTGAINVDGTRIKSNDEIAMPAVDRILGGREEGWDRPWKADDAAVDAKVARAADAIDKANNLGRWPANLLLTDAELFDEPNPGVVGSGATASTGGDVLTPDQHAWMAGSGPEFRSYGDTGGYSRFFLIPKADRAERERGLGEAPQIERPNGNKWTDQDYRSGRIAQRANVHPTVKPIDLMRHLVRLVTPPGGVCLDPFLGSGTTALAASEEGFRCIGIEREAEYLEIAKGRLIATPMGLGLTEGDAA